VNDYLLSALLGIVEGLTEFLPVSSTAHLRITEALCHVDLSSGYWKMYTIVIQLGAILCLPIYFRDRIVQFVRTFPQGEYGDRTVYTHPLTLVMVAFVTTALPAFAMTKLIGKHLESLYIMGAALLIGGVVMWWVDAKFGKRRPADGGPAYHGPPGFEPVGVGTTEDEHGLARPQPRGELVYGLAAVINPEARVVGPAAQGFHPTDHMEDMNLLQAVWIGAWQILSAVFPGTSRSMSTIAAGQIAGMSRRSALEFSFFLSIPTMVVATGYEFLKTVVLKKGHAPGETLPPIDMTAERWLVLLSGFFVSFFVAWAVVAWFMHWVRRRGFAPFAVYRIVVGTAVLIWAVMGAGK
jgi:undecaprenyl-diphosphatase